MPPVELPSYLEKPPEVASRFERIARRKTVLEIRGLGKTFESRTGAVQTLQGIDLSVRHREFICVIGRSGCGKSTLARIVAGLETPSEGEVVVDGRAVHGPGADRGMVFQGYTLFPWLTVTQNIMFGLRQGGMDRWNAEREAQSWIRIVGLAGFADHYPSQLSGGMKQRVAIARALANKPRILLMDEPFGALDAQTRATMQSYLQQIWQNVEITVLFITHDLDEAIYLADRIVVLEPHPGRVREVIEVPLVRPREPAQLTDPRFLVVKRRLEHLIHGEGHGEQEPATTEISLPVARADMISDEVL